MLHLRFTYCASIHPLIELSPVMGKSKKRRSQRLRVSTAGGATVPKVETPKLKRKGKKAQKASAAVRTTKTKGSSKLPAGAAAALGDELSVPADATTNAKQDGESPSIGGKDAKDALYAAGDVILLVGEGDLSFATALLRKFSSNTFVVATVFDTAKQLRHKYPESAANMKLLKAAGMMVQCGVDCRRLHEEEKFKETLLVLCVLDWQGTVLL
eukprot:TRINITY_DN35083_c0_g1_i3.p1 TRINITY_DN35083_c0_g1~~TRINITY_DN35083_c0_g1_i3.p1  ORF type:complete len:222 (+),score=47.43 TRINITY_DN35083_c0_g1_i3:29-667(+)